MKLNLNKQMLGSKAVFEVIVGSKEFRVYLPNKGTPGNIATALASIAGPYAGSNFGQLVCDFITAIGPTAKSELLSDDYIHIPHYRLYRNSLQLRVRVLNRTYGDNLFDGNVAEFADWASNSSSLDCVVLKTVQFVYNAGTKPGQTRTIRVEKVGYETKGTSWIEGYDLSESELKTAYKRYNCDKMVGDIVILN